MIGYRRAKRRRETGGKLQGERSMEEGRRRTGVLQQQQQQGGQSFALSKYMIEKQFLFLLYFFLDIRTADRYWTGSKCPICVKLIP